MIATSPKKIPDMTFRAAIIATVALLPRWFVKSQSPTPPCASAVEEKLGFKESLGEVFRNRGFFVSFCHGELGAGKWWPEVELIGWFSV